MESGQKSKTALVTGGTRGIGLGIAQALAKDGWNLILNGVRPENQIAQVLDNLRALDCQVAYAQGDIGSKEGRKAIREAAREASGGQVVNLLVNNAGVAPKERLDLLASLNILPKTPVSFTFSARPSSPQSTTEVLVIPKKVLQFCLTLTAETTGELDAVRKGVVEWTLRRLFPAYTNVGFCCCFQG